jgi:hypothetical protein
MNEQPREHPVPCSICRRMTWNVTAICNKHDSTDRVDDESEVDA